MTAIQPPTVFDQIRAIYGVRDVLLCMSEMQRGADPANGDQRFYLGLEVLANTLDMAIGAIDSAVDDISSERRAPGGICTDVTRQKSKEAPTDDQN